MRYARLEPLEITGGLEGKEVAVVGAGATGSRMLEQLARMGADLKVIDRDFLEEPNLATSALYTDRGVEEGLPKAVAAGERLEEINSTIRIEAEVADLNPSNVENHLSSADIVMDGTDNMETRFLLNDYCLKEGVPWIHVSALETSGEVMPVVPGETACFECVFSGVDGSSLETCETAGILPAAASTAASLGVGEALRVLAGERSGELVRFDLSGGEFSRLKVEQVAGCRACSREEFPYLEGEKGSSTTSVCGEDKYQVKGEPVDLDSVAQKLPDSGEVELNPYLLRFRGEEEFTLFRDGRMIVEAESPERARSIRARFVGN